MQLQLHSEYMFVITDCKVLEVDAFEQNCRESQQQNLIHKTERKAKNISLSHNHARLSSHAQEKKTARNSKQLLGYTQEKQKGKKKNQKQKLSYKNYMSSVYHSSSDELWSREYTINRTSGRAGTQGCPGRTISKPRKLNVLRSGPLSSRLFLKQIKTYLTFIFSSAYSSRASNPSLLPSAKMPSGISTKRL